MLVFKKFIKILILPLREFLFKLLKSEMTKIAQKHINLHLHLCSMAMRNVVIGGMEGDYFEFGARTGKSFILAHNSYKMIYSKYFSKNPDFHRQKMRFIAFDAWELGFPEETGDKTFKPQHWKQGSMNESKSNFINNLKSNKVDLNDVILVQGYFENTLNSALFIASETSPILKPTTIISNPASMKVFLTTFLIIIKASGIVTNA